MPPATENSDSLAADDETLSESTARRLYTSGDAAHDFDHVLRVTHLGMRIAQAEGADIAVVRAAALLHDVPVSGTGRGNHHFAAAEFAADHLRAEDWDAARIENVVHCIRAHRFRDRSIQPQTLEAKCLYDADKLDSIGAIGVARAFSHTGSHNTRIWTQPVDEAPPEDAQPNGSDYTPVHEYVYKLRHVLSTLHTAAAQEIGAQRHQFMARFYEQLDAEMSGNR